MVAAVLGAVVLLHLFLPVHHAGPAARLLPRVVKLDQAGDRFVRKLTMKKGVTDAAIEIEASKQKTHHLSDAVKALAVELECLLEEDLILDGPLVGEGRKVGQIEHRPLEVVLVPEQHAQRLLAVVSVLFFGHRDVLLHWTKESENSLIFVTFIISRTDSHLLSGISFVGDQTSRARSFTCSGLRSGAGTMSGQTAW